MVNPLALTDIEADRLVLCEGPQDRAFLGALHQDRKLPPAQITCPSNHKLPGGKDGFRLFLLAIRAWTSFPRLKELVIVADSDADPTAAFQSVAEHLRAAGGYPVPVTPHDKAAGSPSVVVLMVPWHDLQGALETICFDAAAGAHPAEAGCVNKFASCTGADNWPPQKFAKMRIHALVAATHRQNPGVGLGNVWAQAPSLIPISAPAFDRIADFFRNL
ncbi:MAG: hypothetical protein JNM75_12010 [Rhodospirillales bacterium]|nr:hypothetical protein [Rhodospirillales bacterium]